MHSSGLTTSEADPAVRPATAGDEGVIHALHARCFADLFAGRLGDWVAPDEPRAERERSWTGPIGSPSDRHDLLVAECRRGVVGFVAVGPTRDADRDRRTTGEVMTIMVDGKQRGSGVGPTLMAAGERAMRANGLAKATLWVVPENTRAVRFYEHFGWVSDGTLKRLSIGGHELTAARYQKTLDE